MIYLGIDPGLSGAAVWILPGESIEQIGYADARTRMIMINGSARRTYDCKRTAEWLDRLLTHHDDQPISATIEAITPGMKGTIAAQSMGVCFGMWEGLLNATAFRREAPITFSTVRPAEWKKELGLIGDNTKRKALALARKLYPQSSDWMTLAKHDGRAEALLIAHYTLTTTRKEKP